MTLKDKLEYHYKAFNKSQISPDPLEFLHKYINEKDIEVMGFIASVFAYGNITQIINTLNRFVHLADNQPFNFISNYSKSGKTKLIHRFYTAKDADALFILLNRAYSDFGTLKNLFLNFYNPDSENLKEAISEFSKYFIKSYNKLNRREELSIGIRFMFPSPELESACKRMNLFLRWMVRKDELDFGLWKEITPDKLIIPVDTHVARISRKLKLTKRKNVSWRMAEEITAKLKKFDPLDPVKYDFAICHIGMRKLKF